MGAANKLLSAPWHGSAVGASRTRYNHCTVFGNYGVKIAEVQGRGRAATEARRDFIVRACNAHNELVEALTELLPCVGWSNYSDKELQQEDDLGNGVAIKILRARTALAKVSP